MLDGKAGGRSGRSAVLCINIPHSREHLFGTLTRMRGCVLGRSSKSVYVSFLCERKQIVEIGWEFTYAISVCCWALMV